MNYETTLVSKLENAFNVSFSLILKISLLTARYCSIHHGMLITTNKFYYIKIFSYNQRPSLMELLLSW